MPHAKKEESNVYWTQIIIFLLLLSSLFSKENVHVISQSALPAGGFFNREVLEVEQLLVATGRATRFSAVKRVCLLLFILGALLAILFDNPFMVPILGAGFAFTPIWYLRSTAAVYKKHLNEELETAISVITTSYLRSGDLLTAVKENLPYLNPPVKGHFESFIIESEMINANMISTLNNLKMKIPNQIFHEWCNTLIQCQSDRTMRNTLTYTVQKFSDQRILQSELEAIINEPKKEAFAMMFLVVGNIPLLYVLNHSWFETLMYSIPGKITLAVCAAIVLFSFTRIMALSKPVEYK